MRITKSNQEKNKKENYKKILKRVKKEVKGITLIALVVTIIVMLILAGITLNLTIGNNGIFKRAENARDTWEIAQSKEQSETDKAADFIERYENENRPLNSVNGEETSNSIVYDKYGNKVVVPAGFKIINPEDDVTKGIVIEDVNANGSTEYTKGSQFVWIPVGNVYIDENQDYDRIILGRYTFDSNGKEKLIQTATKYEEVLVKYMISSSTSNETKLLELEKSSYGNASAKNLKEFIEGTETNGGFYISRYEAGDNDAKNKPRGEESEITKNVVSKQGVYPYNYVTQQEASTLCQDMYITENYETDLINSYALNTAIVFIQKFSDDNKYSVKGRLQEDLARCGEASDGITNDIKCNIYDLAGNVREWTTETSDRKENPCVAIGGGFNDDYNYVSYRDRGNPIRAKGDTGFRICMYL